jgi:predicted transcriptional regulator
MCRRSGNTGYNSGMAKVMISMPDELLEQLDKQAGRLGQTRSGLLQRLVEREVAHRSAVRQAEVERLLALAGPAGGDSVAQLRADRARR